MLTSWLRTRGYTVHAGFSADKLRGLWLEHRPDVVIVEAQQAGVDTLGLCRELRAQHDALVLAMTEEASARVEAYCLEAGADAFVGKPVGPKLLLAHLRALSRRVRSSLQRQPSTQLRVGPIHFDAARNTVRVDGVGGGGAGSKAGSKVAHLTPTESRILQILAVNVGDVCTQGQIVAHAWGYGEEGDAYLIKAHIRHLREKIEPEPSKPRYIRTVPGVGYSLTIGNASTGSSSGSDEAEDDDPSAHTGEFRDLA